MSSECRPTVLLSVETGVRELPSKLALASALAAANLDVVLGHKEAVSAIGVASRRIIWQGKSLFSLTDAHPLADRLLRNDSRIMFISDEGAMHQADSWEAQTLHKHWVDHLRTRGVQRICLWGSRQGDVIARYAPELASTLRVTGSPRFDMCLPHHAWTSSLDKANEAIPQRPFMLFCTRFGAVAQARGIQFPFVTKLNAKAWPAGMPAHGISALWFSKWRQDAHDLAEFMMLIRAVAHRYPEYAIVVRPHPSENLAFYREAFILEPNVMVIRDGSALDWIRAAALTIHTNCTTGVEAVMASRPTINFRPPLASGERQDVEVAREAGTSVASIPAALEAVDRALAGAPFAQEWSEDARAMLNNLNDEAIPRMVAETVTLVAESGLDGSRLVMPRRFGLRATTRRLLGRRDADDYVAGKRGLLAANYVEQILEGYRTRGLGRGVIRDICSTHVLIGPA